MRSPRWVPGRARLRWGLLLAACVLCYANGLTGAFTYDDKAIIRDNPRIRTPRNLPRVFTTSYFGGRGSGTNYRPVLLLSFALQWWAHGSSAPGFHAVNLALHVLVTLLLARLLLRIGLSPPAVLAAALLFAVHPIHIEAVTSLVGRGETLAAVFVLLYLDLAFRIREARTGSPRAGALGLALLCYGLAVLTKESAAVAPGLAFLLLCFVAAGSWGNRLRAALSAGFPLYAGSALLLAGDFALRSRILGGYLKGATTAIFEVENPLAPLPAAARAANSCVILFRYLGRILFPLHLSADESAWSIRVLPARSPLAAAAVLLLAMLCALALARLPRGRADALGLLFFVVAFLPTGNLLFANGTVFAERLAYLPSAGICLVVGALLAGAAPSLGQTRACALAAAALLLAARTVVRNPVWWTDETLFANCVATSPASAKAHYNYAYVSAFYSRQSRALFHYAQAVRIYDAYWDAWAGKGRMEKQLGCLAEAEKSYEKAIAINRAYENGYFGLGLVREARGEDSAARQAYRRGLDENPRSLPLLYRLALLDSRLVRSEAEAQWRRATALAPGSLPVRVGFGEWLLGAGRPREAGLEAREALRRDPRWLPALRLLAEADARTGSLFGEALAREKAFRVSRSAEDLSPLLRAAERDPAYRDRFERLRPELVRLSPQAFLEARRVARGAPAAPEER